MQRQREKRTMQNSMRTVIGRVLGAVGLRHLTRKLETAIGPQRFQPATPATPAAVEKVLNRVTITSLGSTVATPSGMRRRS